MKMFFATYIDDVNLNSGDEKIQLKASLLRDEENVLYSTDWDYMQSLCIDDANFYINNCAGAEARGYEIVETNDGCIIVDNEGYIIVTYNIHEIDMEITLK